MTNYKIDRIESDIIKYLSNIILTETRDNLLKTVTLTEVVVSKDLSYAKVYFTSISDLAHKKMENELNNASPFLRRELAKVLEIRNIPELKFIYDEQLENINRIESIISEIKREDNEE